MLKNAEHTSQMKRILAPILLLTLLFPSLALGGEVKFDDLVVREGLYFKKFTHVPFTGKVTGESQGSFRNGMKHGPLGQVPRQRTVTDQTNPQGWKETRSLGLSPQERTVRVRRNLQGRESRWSLGQLPRQRTVKGERDLQGREEGRSVGPLLQTRTVMVERNLQGRNRE